MPRSPTAALLAVVLALATALLAVSTPSYAAAASAATAAEPEHRFHIALAVGHHQGHLTPYLALAKELAVQHPEAHITIISSSFAEELVLDKLGSFGVDFLSAGTLPWSAEEDSRKAAEMIELPPMERFRAVREIFSVYEVLGTEVLLAAFNHTRPDFLVVDPMFFCAINVADHYSIPYLFFHTSGLPLVDSWNSFFVSKPVHIASMIAPPADGTVSSPLLRLKNRAIDVAMYLMTQFIFAPIHLENRDGLGIAPPKAYLRMGSTPTPILLSTAWGFAEPMSLPPYVQLVGSVYDPTITPAPPMSADLQQWLGQDSRPVVYVSTGTNARLLPDQLAALATAFNSLPQYRFLWSLKSAKYPDGIPLVNDNVRIEDFVPQATVLAHKNVKVFLSHCGQNSMLESIQNHVPILALPFMADQPSNAHMLEKNGAALQLSSTNITTTLVAQSLERLITEPTFRQNTQRLRSLLSVAGGREQAARWVWLIARHGSDFLIPGELTVGWFLYYELDIVLAQLVLVAVLSGLVLGAFRCIKHCCCRSAAKPAAPVSTKKQN